MTVAEQAGAVNTTHFNVLLKEVLAEAASALEAEEVVAAALAQMDTVSRIIVTTSRRFFWPPSLGFALPSETTNDSRQEIWAVILRKRLETLVWAGGSGGGRLYLLGAARWLAGEGGRGGGGGGAGAGQVGGGTQR